MSKGRSKTKMKAQRARARLLDADQAAQVDVPHYLMWVGGQFYPTVDDFVAEAGSMGVSKRISKVPQDVVVGKSKVYLAHANREATIKDDPILSKLQDSHREELISACRKIHKEGLTPKVITQPKHKRFHKKVASILRRIQEQDPDLKVDDLMEAGLRFATDKHKVVFGYYVVSRIEFIVPLDGRVPEKIQELVDKGHVKLVSYAQAASEPMRGCGYRKAGGLYATSYEIDAEAMKALRADAKDVDLYGPLAVFRKPFTAPVKFSRGIQKIEGEVLRKIQVREKLMGLKKKED